jgi:transposase InsO family protein
LEYARSASARYLAASRAQKGMILDEFCQTTGRHRKSAVRLLRHPPAARPKKVGRPRKYGPEVGEDLKRLWEASGQMGSKRLRAFLGELIEVLERQGEIRLAPERRVELVGLSASSIDRLLRPYRRTLLRRPYTTRSSPGALKAQIPIRTFGEWEGVNVGSLQLDLVAHCGESTEGFYLNTLVSVDVATSWSEFGVVWGKGMARVKSAIAKTSQRLPFAVKEIHTDNGSEFINELIYPWCRDEQIKLTRGRPYKKNDQAYVEQKNWQVPRRLVGYDRYTSRSAYAEFQHLYRLVPLYVNFFQPVQRLLSKERVGSKVRKRYDEPKTPYRRLLATGVLDEAKQAELRDLYERLNPVRLQTRIDESLEALWKLADRPGRTSLLPSTEPTPASVTPLLTQQAATR